LPDELRNSVEQGLFRYLASNPVCRGDDTRHKDRTSGADRAGGPSVPAPNGAGGTCHHLHFYTAAQNDAKISDIKLAQGPRATWNATRDTGEALYKFLDIIRPLTGLVESMFQVVVPEIWDIYNKVYGVLPVSDTLSKVKRSFGIWASRSIVLNAQTNLHVDLMDVCRGFCAIVPLGNFNGGNVCLPTLGISIPLAAGKFV